MSANGVTVFICKRGGDKLRCTSSGCSNLAIVACQFELKGKKIGTVCGRALCSSCAQTDSLCPSHRRFTEAKTAASR